MRGNKIIMKLYEYAIFKTIQRYTVTRIISLKQCANNKQYNAIIIVVFK